MYCEINTLKTWYFAFKTNQIHICKDFEDYTWYKMDPPNTKKITF